ncbi:uncharacterized protein V6R79_024088 [Siganus canaliculatus]
MQRISNTLQRCYNFLVMLKEVPVSIQLRLHQMYVKQATIPSEVSFPETRAYASPLDRWQDGLALRQVRGLQTEGLRDELRRDQSEEQVQNVFKRFLFHYSKARNSVGAVQQEIHWDVPFFHTEKCRRQLIGYILSSQVVSCSRTELCTKAHPHGRKMKHTV